MAAQRLPVSRLAGIAAWTAASVAWGTAAVAIANTAPSGPDDALPIEGDGSEIAVAPQEMVENAPLLPEGGVVVLRYTPISRPEPEVIVRRVTVNTPAATSQPAATREKSSGS